MQRGIKSVYNIRFTIAIAFPEIEFPQDFPAELSHIFCRRMSEKNVLSGIDVPELRYNK